MYWTRRVSRRNAGIAERDELLAVAAADDQRAFLARPDQQPRLVGAHRDERVVAAKLRVGARGRPRRGRRRCAAATRWAITSASVSEVNTRALAEQLLLERDVVLDDPVDDDVDAVGGVEVRMRVLLGDAAVRRPAGVADSGPGVRSVRRRATDAAARRACVDRARAAARGCRPRGPRRSGRRPAPRSRRCRSRGTRASRAPRAAAARTSRGPT